MRWTVRRFCSSHRPTYALFNSDLSLGALPITQLSVQPLLRMCQPFSLCLQCSQGIAFHGGGTFLCTVFPFLHLLPFTVFVAGSAARLQSRMRMHKRPCANSLVQSSPTRHSHYWQYVFLPLIPVFNLEFLKRTRFGTPAPSQQFMQSGLNSLSSCSKIPQFSFEIWSCLSLLNSHVWTLFV